MPPRGPILFLTRIAAVPGGLALRANLEVLQKPLYLAPVIAAILSALQRSSTEHLELVDWIMPPLPQPMYHAGHDIRGDVVALRDPSRRGDPGGLPHVPNLAGVRLVSVHAIGESNARLGEPVLGGLAHPLYHPPLATRDATV